MVEGRLTLKLGGGQMEDFLAHRSPVSHYVSAFLGVNDSSGIINRLCDIYLSFNRVVHTVRQMLILSLYYFTEQFTS